MRAEDRAQNAAHPWKLPRSANRWRPNGGNGVSAVPIGGLESRRHAGENAGGEQVADAGDAVQSIETYTGIGVVQVLERALLLPAKPEAQGEVGLHAPGVLTEAAVLQHAVAVDLRHESVLVRVFVERHVARDGGDAAGEGGVERAGVAQLRAGSTGEVGGGEDVGGACVDRVVSGKT